MDKENVYMDSTGEIFVCDWQNFPGILYESFKDFKNDRELNALKNGFCSKCVFPILKAQHLRGEEFNPEKAKLERYKGKNITMRRDTVVCPLCSRNYGG